MGEVVDPAFVQDIEHQPIAIGADIAEAEGIPLVSLSSLMDSWHDDHHANIEGLVAEIQIACKEWGFFQVINHGVPFEKLRRLEDATMKFFKQPLEEKLKVRRDNAGPMGYYEMEYTRNVRDWKEVFDVTVPEPTLIPVSYRPDSDEVTHWSNKWPVNLPELREACEEYAKAVEKLAFRLTEVMALSLGLPADRFYGFFKDLRISSMRLNHYPPCPAPNLVLGVGPHIDFGVLTVLATAQNDVGGLEIKRKSDGGWIPVKPKPNALIINVGDIMQVWSNGTFESVEHRAVVNSDRERLSIPFSLGPAHYTMVEPLEELVTKQSPAKYRAYNWGKFLVTRKYSNFMKLDVENLQIHHFKIPDMNNNINVNNRFLASQNRTYDEIV